MALRVRKRVFFDFLVFMFFVIVHIDYMGKTNVTLVLRYGISFLCFLLPVIVLKIPRGFSFWLLAALTVLTGIVNILFIGNTTAFKLGYTVMSFFIAKFFLQDVVTEKPFLFATYVNALSVIGKYIMSGSMGKIYPNSSGNYVSIMLLISLTLYYVKCEMRNVEMKILPCVITFILCIMATGRGGILSSGVMLVALLVMRLKSSKDGNRQNKAIKTLILLVSVICVTFCVPAIVHSNLFESVFGRFDSLGMSDHGRYDIWAQYIAEIRKTTAYTLWGAPLNNIPIVVSHENNLHNSFLNIHAFNGIFVFTTVLLVCIYSLGRGIRNKNWVFVICFLIILLRGFTDQMFWGTIATPVFGFYLFFDRKYDGKERGMMY